MNKRFYLLTISWSWPRGKMSHALGRVSMDFGIIFILLLRFTKIWYSQAQSRLFKTAAFCARVTILSSSTLGIESLKLLLLKMPSICWKKFCVSILYSPILNLTLIEVIKVFSAFVHLQPNGALMKNGICY